MTAMNIPTTHPLTGRWQAARSRVATSSEACDRGAARLARRATAALLEFALYYPAAVAFNVGAGVAVGYAVRQAGGDADVMYAVVTLWLPLTSVLGWTLLAAWFEGGPAGRFYSKHLVRLQVVGRDGNPGVGFRRALARRLLGMVGGGAAGLAVWTMPFDREHRTLHDLATGCRVVQTSPDLPRTPQAWWRTHHR